MRSTSWQATPLAAALKNAARLPFSMYVLTVCVPATKLAIQTPRKQPETGLAHSDGLASDNTHKCPRAIRWTESRRA